MKQFIGKNKNNSRNLLEKRNKNFILSSNARKLYQVSYRDKKNTEYRVSKYGKYRYIHLQHYRKISGHYIYRYTTNQYKKLLNNCFYEFTPGSGWYYNQKKICLRQCVIGRAFKICYK